MQHYLQQLNQLIENLPGAPSARSFSTLHSVLGKYKSVLDCINSYNEGYKSTTTLYYNDLESIKANMQLYLYATTQQQKETAFETAKRDLRTDIESLSKLLVARPESQALALA